MVAIKNWHRVMIRRTGNVYNAQKRRARKVNQQLDYDLELLRRVVNAALELPCCYCGLPMNATDWTIDHAEPVSRGGLMAFANLVVVHRRCNEIKSNMNQEEFVCLLQLLQSFDAVVRRDLLARLRAGGKMIRR